MNVEDNFGNPWAVTLKIPEALHSPLTATLHVAICDSKKTVELEIYILIRKTQRVHTKFPITSI